MRFHDSPYRFILLLIYLFLFFFRLQAGETGKVSGRVIDKSTNQVLAGATIRIISKISEGVEEKYYKPLGATTDINGTYYILSVPPGIYNIQCSYIGYGDEVVTKVKVSIDRTSKVDFALAAQTQVTGEVVITAFSPLKVEQDLTATKQTYEVEQVKEIAGVQDIGDILALQPDILDDHFRGGRLGQSAYLIGGSSIVNPLSNQRAFSPIVNGLKQVEVLTSGFSAEYGNAQSGIVNMIPKEGGDTWKTTLDISGAMPGYKTWGGNPYNHENQQFFDLLARGEEWLKNDPSTGVALWNLGNSFSSYAAPLSGEAGSMRDTMRAARIAQAFFYQSLRDVGLEFNNTVDSRIDFTISGPLNESTKLFVTGRQRTNYPILPTPYPDMYRQIMSNLTYQPTESDKFGFRFIWDYQFENLIATSSFLRLLYNRTMGVTKSVQNTYQFGFDWRKIFTNSLVMELKLNILNVLNQRKLEVLQDGEYGYTYTNYSNWATTYTDPAQHTFVSLPSEKWNDRVNTLDFHGFLNYQINGFNLLKTGIQIAQNRVNVNRDMGISNESSYRKVRFEVAPYEGGIYLQDKMEFEGFIANVGLRLDFYDMNTNYYSNLFSPLKNPYYDETKPPELRGKYYDASLADKKRTSLYTKLQPRVGLSFPISESSVFHINYGTFTQRPSYEQIFYNQIDNYGQIYILGNPRLKPENTKMYDLGIVNAFPAGIKFDISAYYKDIKDLVESAYYIDKQQNSYFSFSNRDYSDVKGFFITIEKNDENLELFARYNYEAATGKSSNEFDALVTYFENPPEGQNAVELPAAADVYMDYDRTHKLVSNIRYKLNDDEGGEVFGLYPLENSSISVTFRLFSGRPYTYDNTGQRLRFNKRTPTEYDLRARIQKRLRIGSTNLTVYLEGMNLLNMKIFNYSAVFSGNNINSSTRSASDLSRNNTDHYEKEPGTIDIFRPGPFSVQNDNPYISSQAMYVYQNQPVSFRLGLIFGF